MPERQEMILVRHGQSTANVAGVWQGQLEFPLSDEGRLQARSVGKALAGEQIDGIYSSPLTRAYETAEIIARGTSFPGAVVPMQGLAERRGGLLEGTTRAEREARDPELAMKLRGLPEEERWALVGAETDEEVLYRFEREISSIRHAPGTRVVVVSHGGVMRAFLRHLFGTEVLPGSVRAPNASITRIEWTHEGTPCLTELASTHHLAEGTARGTSIVE